MTDTDDELAAYSRALFAEQTGSGLFGPPEPPADPATDSAPPTGPVSLREGDNPTSAPSADHEMRELVRDLFDRNK